MKLKLFKYKNCFIYFLFIFFINIDFIQANNIGGEQKIQKISEQQLLNSDEINNEAYDDFDDDFDIYEDENDSIILVKDPFEKMNRKIFSFNIFVLENVATPFVKFYNTITNKFIRDRINNFGNRFSDPMILINSILQLDIKNSLKTIGTFATNMTIGIFGLFNPAQTFGFYREKLTFGQTLAHYGIGDGIYLMIPFFGPSTLREGFGTVLNLCVDPFSFNLLKFGGDSGDITPEELLVPKYVGRYIGSIDGAIKLNNEFLKKSFDPYIFSRDSYIQNLKYKNNND